MESVVIFASTSGIAQAVAEEFARRQIRVILCARNADALERQARDLQVKYGREATTIVWDLKEAPEVQAQKVQDLFREHPVDGLFMAAGVMPPQASCEANPEQTVETLHVNFTAVAVLLNLFAEQLITQGKGFISCLSSVAGDRGRQSNYVYGASKAGLSTYLQGMRNRLHKYGILVQTVKPGYVNTAMTAHLGGSPLMAEPEAVAKHIVDAIKARKDVIYTPFFWRYIMSIIKAIPEPLFKRLSL